MTGAYSFVCQYNSTASLLQRFEAMAGWQWSIGDSHWYGDYLACGPFAGVRIRIVDFPHRADQDFRYESDIRISPECRTPMTEIDAAYRKVLAQIPAQDVKEIEWFD